MNSSLLNKIRDSICGNSCFKCGSEHISLLHDKRFYCKDCKNKFTGRVLNDRLQMLYCFYLGFTVNKVSADLQFSYNKVKRFYFEMLQKIHDELHLNLNNATKSIYIEKLELTPIAKNGPMKDSKLILIVGNLKASIISYNIVKNKIVSNDLKHVIKGKKLQIYGEELKNLFEYSFKKSTINTTENQHEISIKFQKEFCEKVRNSRGISPNFEFLYDYECLYRILHKENLYESLILSFIGTKMNE